MYRKVETGPIHGSVRMCVPSHMRASLPGHEGEGPVNIDTNTVRILFSVSGLRKDSFRSFCPKKRVHNASIFTVERVVENRERVAFVFFFPFELVAAVQTPYCLGLVVLLVRVLLLLIVVGGCPFGGCRGKVKRPSKQAPLMMMRTGMPTVVEVLRQGGIKIKPVVFEWHAAKGEGLH